MTCGIAGTYNITCQQGATLKRTITWRNPNKTPINVTGYTARMHVRSTVDASTTALELTTENSRITLGGALGTVTLNVNATTTANLTPAIYVYDLELISGGGEVNRVIEGNFVVKAEVTR
jgi:LEA14-like dessication related protein